ncbi:MAG: hypothetical protein IJ653_08095 [Bacteroidales bacterium]|nr:hypothetical protein [Bacteroidales bacterium]
MDWDVLIPILMFLFPLVVSILDKRAKKRKGVPPVKAEPLFPPAEDIDQEERAEAPGRASDYPTIPLEGAQGVNVFRRSVESAEGGTVRPGRPSEPLSQAQQDVFRGELPIRSPQEGKPDTFVMEATQTVTEGQRAIDRHIETPAGSEEKPKLEIDKKKLILYSEILKPKFDA